MKEFLFLIVSALLLLTALLICGSIEKDKPTEIIAYAIPTVKGTQPKGIIIDVPAVEEE